MAAADEAAAAAAAADGEEAENTPALLEITTITIVAMAITMVAITAIAVAEVAEVGAAAAAAEDFFRRISSVAVQLEAEAPAARGSLSRSLLELRRRRLSELRRSLRAAVGTATEETAATRTSCSAKAAEQMEQPHNS